MERLKTVGGEVEDKNIKFQGISNFSKYETSNKYFNEVGKTFKQ